MTITRTIPGESRTRWYVNQSAVSLASAQYLPLKFNAEPAFSRFNLAGESFNLSSGLFGLAVSPKCEYCYNYYGESQRQLFFHGLASGKENSVPLNVIDNQMNFISNPNAMASSFKTIGNRGVQTPGKIEALILLQSI
jgi:hypothetical protein